MPRVECNCAYCGAKLKPRIPSKIYKSGLTFCNREHSSLYKNKQIECKCEYCGEIVLKQKYYVIRNGFTFCNKEHFHLYRKSKRIECKCAYCDKTFYKTLSSIYESRLTFCNTQHQVLFQALIPRSIETREKMSVSARNVRKREEHVELRIGGFWYGNVKYYDKKKYCELWTRNLMKRIRLFFGNKSPLSGKTIIENAGRRLSCHHVYHQPKACCEWSEDEQGYYATIDGERYYVGDEPNKFIPLTSGENSMVEHNKLTYIKIFEDLIRNKYGGISYYTKEEYKWIMQEPFMNEHSQINGTYFPPDFDHGR